MKIGIMTFWWSEDNYGQLLQCYALQKYLRDAGHDAYLIRYDPRNDYVKSSLWEKILGSVNPVGFVKYCIYTIKGRWSARESIILGRFRKFNDFRNKYIKQSDKVYYSYNELVESPPEADVYIVGSDQVWNFSQFSINRIRSRLKAYFLDFGKTEIGRIAYAASFGKEEIAADHVKEITPLLQKFDYIFVREKSGLDICQKCGVSKAQWVPDPTMLLKADDYRSLYTESIIKIEGPYCLMYMLKNETDFSMKVVYNWARRKNLKIVYVTGNSRFDKYDKIYATIPEWLYLIDNAEYVLTNSFHCAVFSLIFEKKFGIFPRAGNSVGLNSRFTSLFEMFDIKERYVIDFFAIMDIDINWINVNKKLEEYRNSCQLHDIL
jgi:hypothetical protein